LDLVIREVTRRHPTTPIFLFGHSLGGAITALYVLQRHPPIAGLVLSAPGLRSARHISGGLIALTKFLSAIAPKAGVLKTPNADFSRDPKVVREMDQDPLIYQGSLPARTAAEFLRMQNLIRDHVGGVGVPRLVLHGTADRLTSSDASTEWASRNGDTDSALKLYPGLFHDLLHEPERGIVFNDIVQWMDRHLEASRSLAPGPGR
jgi:acylglycerol lipase